MANVKIDATPGKKRYSVPKDPEGRKAHYERIMASYEAQNPVKFAAKKAELQKKADGFEYIAGKWVNIFRPSFVAEEVKLTASQKEQAELERINALNQEKDAKIADLEARLGALEAKKEEVVEEKPKPKGRSKKTK